MDYFICDFCFSTISQGELYYKINGKTACEICAAKKNKNSNNLFGSIFPSNNMESEGYINDNGDRDF